MSTCSHDHHDHNHDHVHEDEGVIILTDESGNDLPFVLLDLIPYAENNYVVLYPKDPSSDDVGNLSILRVDNSDDEDITDLSSVEDQEILDEVFDLFRERNKDVLLF